jgi:hypothetical protein
MVSINKSIGPLLFSSLLCLSAEGKAFTLNQSFYVGAIGGYGSTTWQGLVPNEEHKNSALQLSTPIKVEEGGAVWGFLAGYEIIPAFALEAYYLRYPNAGVLFDESSLFSLDHDDAVRLDTKTEALNLMGKIMLPIPHTTLSIYSGAGAAWVHREDLIVNHWRLSPTFAVGINYRLAKHAMIGFGGSYTAGYGESQLSPTDTFFPFLYEVSARLAFRF